jgi:hypothetical protein
VFQGAHGSPVGVTVLPGLAVQAPGERGHAIACRGLGLLPEPESSATPAIHPVSGDTPPTLGACCVHGLPCLRGCPGRSRRSRQSRLRALQSRGRWSLCR